MGKVSECKSCAEQSGRAASVESKVSLYFFRAAHFSQCPIFLFFSQKGPMCHFAENYPRDARQTKRSASSPTSFTRIPDSYVEMRYLRSYSAGREMQGVRATLGDNSPPVRAACPLVFAIHLVQVVRVFRFCAPNITHAKCLTCKRRSRR